MEFKKLVQQRRSHRQFSDEPVADEHLRLILRAALMSPTSKGSRSWHFYVVHDKKQLTAMSEAKAFGAKFLAESPLAVIVTGNPEENYCWIEDGAIAAISMQYQAQDLGLGSCWVQFRDNKNTEGIPSDDLLHSILALPAEQKVLCAVAIGHATDERQPQNEEKLKWEHAIL